MMMFLLNVGLG
uniref:Uncharacterized protein n=1 Tax=Arundo donax TaxID=35708 RepID=A0A0A9HGG6_ARUDO